MNASRSVKLLLALLVAGFVLAICGTGAAAIWFVTRRVSPPRVAEGEPLLNRIAFVDNAGDLWLATPDGMDLQRRLAGIGGVRFPTWSPDGRRLAFVALNDTGNTALYVAEGERGETAVLFDDPVSAPFYIYWSPDSRSVTFLTQEPNDLSMRVVDATDPSSSRIMAQGSPFYWVWSPTANQLFMHVGGAAAFSENAHLSFLENAQDAQRVELNLDPGRFQAPAWSTNGDYVSYIAADKDGNEAIYKSDVVTDQQMLVTPLDGPAYMVMSPGDQYIAYLQVEQDEQFPAVGSAYVVDTQGENKRRVVKDSVASMYWSPDGKKLALLTFALEDENPVARVPGLAAPLTQLARFRWWVYDVETEALELLTTFIPTVAFLQTVPFFDQYHLSLTFWSPDSRYLVITKRETGSAEGTVWILDTTGLDEPRQIGEGTFAVWSWR
jgi:Tol biopolymer transport system component